MIKPIETVYSGYRFRSRLEARWAVFFDYARIDYQYEPEGYVLDDGTMYLPDFYLPDFDLFVEIKPFKRNNEEERRTWEDKCFRFAFNTNQSILLCYGEPAECIYRYLYTQFTDDDGGGTKRFESFFALIGDSISLVVDIVDADIEIYNINSDRVIGCLWKSTMWETARQQNVPWNISDDDYYGYAMLKARRARFEHGEVG